MKLDNPSLFFDTSRKMFRAKKELFVSIPRLAVVGVLIGLQMKVIRLQFSECKNFSTNIQLD